MRYVPNLIPDKSKVFRDYFKGDTYEPRQQNKLLTFLGWFFGVIFIIGAVSTISHPLPAILYGLLGFILLPPGHRFLEKKFRFRFTKITKAILGVVLYATAVLLILHYQQTDKQVAQQLKLKTEQEQKNEAVEAKKEQERKDSLDFYIQASNKFDKDNETNAAIKQLNYALAFASTQTDKDLISNQRIKIAAITAFALVKAGKYQTAIPELNNLIAQDGSNSDLIYNRAICYSKTAKIPEAVVDCKTAIQLGNSNAKKLHDQINPMRKRVTDYVTLCCDGTTTYRKGRGTCSGHNGVCNWNEPVYEEYRKY